MSSSPVQSKEHPPATTGNVHPEHRYGASSQTTFSQTTLVGEQRTARSIQRMQAAVTALAPLVMAVGLVYHPHIGSPTQAGFLERLGAAVEADPTRWAVAHLLVAIASGLIALALLALRSRLRGTGGEKWSRFGVPFIVMGSVLFALLPAMEFAPLTAFLSGADPAAAQGALLPFFAPTLFTGALIFFVGTCGFASGIIQSGTMGATLGRFVAAALVIMAAARFFPIMEVQMYVQAAAGLAALLPIAILMWKDH